MSFKEYIESDELPLKGLRFLVTRKEKKISSVTKILKSKGASVLVTPMTEIVPPRSWDLFDETVIRAEKIDWAVFTSSNGVSGCLNRIKKLEYSPSKIFSKMRIACVGKSTARELVENEIVPDLIPDQFQSEGLIYALKKFELRKKIFWLIQAESPRELLIKELEKQRSEIIFTPVYRNVPISRDYEFLINELKQCKLDWVLFTSPSAVKIFQKILPKGFWISLSNAPRIACLGQITAEAVKSFGWKVEAKPDVQDFENLVQKICEINSKEINF